MFARDAAACAFVCVNRSARQSAGRCQGCARMRRFQVRQDFRISAARRIPAPERGIRLPGRQSSTVGPEAPGAPNLKIPIQRNSVLRDNRGAYLYQRS